MLLLNLCLGLKNKKLEAEHLLIENQIDVLCLQETDIEKIFNSDLLAINGYRLELEINLNGNIPLIWLNDSIDTFKVKCKKQLLI